jgi:hypothetical protein
MPLVTVTVLESKTAAFKDAILAGVHRALVAAGVPEADRFQRVLDLPPENFRFDLGELVVPSCIGTVSDDSRGCGGFARDRSAVFGIERIVLTPYKSHHQDRRCPASSAAVESRSTR